MNEPNEFLDDLAAGNDPLDRNLAAALRSWCDSNQDSTVVPDERLEARFSQEPPAVQPPRWRQWMQRPAIAFAASFAAVLVLGAGAFALVARGSGAEDIAASTSSMATLTAVDDEPGEITLPSDLTKQTGYAGCVLGELTAWLAGGFSGNEAPRLTDTCGLPPIPDLGPEAGAFRSDLEAWTVCVAGAIDAVLPKLPELVKQGLAGDDGLPDVENKCGEPPDPRDYGLQLPFADFDWESFDPSQFNFGTFNLEDLNLESFDLEGLMDKLPDDVLPEDFDIEQWRSHFGDFDHEGFKLDLEACDPSDFPELGGIESLGDLEDLDLKAWFEDLDGSKLCGLAGFFNPDDFGDLDLDQLLSDFETYFGGIAGREDLGLEDY